MHVAFQFDRNNFGLELGGRAIEREEVLSGWNPHDRLGVIVDRPFGVVGASLLMQLVMTAYYDVKPQRREDPPTYPEIYLFHLGTWQGNHGWYDLAPPRKEVLVADEPAAVLEAINDRAITRLLVVDGPAEPVAHHWKEPATAADRITDVWAYSPSGRVRDADVRISALHERLTQNTRFVLAGDRTYEEQMQVSAAAMAELAKVSGGKPRRPDDGIRISGPDRSAAIDEAARNRLLAQRAEISSDGLPVETYRTETLERALGMLHRRDHA